MASALTTPPVVPMDDSAEFPPLPSPKGAAARRNIFVESKGVTSTPSGSSVLDPSTPGKSGGTSTKNSEPVSKKAALVGKTAPEASSSKKSPEEAPKPSKKPLKPRPTPASVALADFNALIAKSDSKAHVPVGEAPSAGLPRMRRTVPAKRPVSMLFETENPRQTRLPSPKKLDPKVWKPTPTKTWLQKARDFLFVGSDKPPPSPKSPVASWKRSDYKGGLSSAAREEFETHQKNLEALKLGYGNLESYEAVAAARRQVLDKARISAAKKAGVSPHDLPVSWEDKYKQRLVGRSGLGTNRPKGKTIPEILWLAFLKVLKLLQSWYIHLVLLALLGLSVIVWALTTYLGVCDSWKVVPAEQLFSFWKPSMLGLWTSFGVTTCPNIGALRVAVGKNYEAFNKLASVSLELSEPVFSHTDLVTFVSDAQRAGSYLHSIQDSANYPCLTSETIADVADLFYQTPKILKSILNDRHDYFKMASIKMNTLPPDIAGCKRGFKDGWRKEESCQKSSTARYQEIIAKQIEHANSTITGIKQGAQILADLAQHLAFTRYIVEISPYNRDQNHLSFFSRLVPDSRTNKCDIPSQIGAYKNVFKKFGKGTYVDLQLATVGIAYELRAAESRLRKLVDETAEEKVSKQHSWIYKIWYGAEDEKIDGRFLMLSKGEITNQIRDRKHTLRALREKNDAQRSAVAIALGQTAGR